jgi:hypothetical protein
VYPVAKEIKMPTRNLVYRVLTVVTLSALLLGSVPATAAPALTEIEGKSVDSALTLLADDAHAGNHTPAHDRVRAAEVPHSAPLMFIENAGQFDRRARFQVRGAERTLWLAEDALWVTLLEPDTPVEQADILNPSIQNPKSEIENRQAVHLKLSFAGANPHPRLEPFDRLDTRVSYFIGDNPADWRADVPVWGGVRYVDLYAGLDLEITGGDTWSWRIVARAPEADLDAVRLRVDGADGLALDGTVDSTGRRSVRVSTALGEFALPLLEHLRGFGGSLQAGSDFMHRELLSYEGHSQPWQALAPKVMGSEVVAPFAEETPVSSGVNTPARVLDRPQDLLYATFLGGSEGEHGESIAVDESGNAYVAGRTASSDFPAASGPGYDTSHNGSVDAFVVKLDPSGTGLDYATFLGGRGNEYQEGLAVDGSGNAYVTGKTSSSDFPATPGAYDTSLGGLDDAFIVKLSASGTSLAYATFLGGSYYEHGGGIVVDRSGNAYVTGRTYSFNFPAASGPGYDTSHNGDYDAFVVKLNPAGTSLAYATFLGGSDTDGGDGIAVDGSGNAYVTGGTRSSDFPAAGGPGYDTTHNGVSDAFVVKLNASGTALDYATFLGGSDTDGGDGIAVDGSGNAYVTGQTDSSNFPAAGGPGYDTTHNGVPDAFVVKLNASGTDLDYATFLGGSEIDRGDSIAVDGSGNAYVTGQTYSPDFPAAGGPGYDTSHNGDYDGFVVKLNPADTSLAYATFLGASGRDYCLGIAVDGSGDAYVTGKTASSDFPATSGPGYDTSYNGDHDAFVVKLALAGLVYPTALDFGATLTELTLFINPENPTDAWTLSESIPWLDLSDTGGTGPATITVSVDRTGQPEGPHSGTINATVSGQAVTVNVTMRVVTPDVTIVTPPPGSTVYQSDSLLIKAVVTLESQPLLGAQVAGGIALPQYGAAPFTLYDDGAHEDGAADDGIYAGRIALYGPLMMPTSGNPYLLTVMATTDSGAASDSVTITLAASDGAPTVAVEVSGPSAPDYFVGQQATVTATLTYPDSSIHTGTAVTLTIIAPDLSVTHVGLTHVADDTWRGTYTFDQGGTTYLDVRADPPASTHFVDGWATATPAPYVYQGALDLALKTPAGPWPLYSRVPLSVCVTSGTQAVSDATVDARFTAPAAGDGGQLDEVGTTGCYRRDYAAQTPGTHTVVIQAQRPAYKTGTFTGTFQVSDQPAVLSDTIQTFETGTIWDMEHGLAHVIQAADDGDYFKEKMKADEFKLVVQGFVDLLGVASAATAPAHIPSAMLFPGWKVVGEEMAGLVSDEVIAALMVEGSTVAERKRVNAAAMTYFATGGDPSRTLPGSDILEAVSKEYYVIIPVDESLADNFAQVLSNTVDVNRARFIARVDETLADLPTLTEPEQTAYVTDLIARQDANEWFGVRDLRYQTNFLNAMRNKREEDEHNYVKIVVVFVAETAVKGVAFYFGDGPGLAAANALALAWHAYLNSEAVKEDQRMRDLALAIMHAGYRAESILYTNSTSALSLIRDKTPPPTPDGAMLSVDLHRTTDGLGFTRDVYADIQIENTGPIPARFGAKAYFQKPDETLRMVEGLTDPATGETMPVVELAPHDPQTLRMYFKKDDEHDHGVPRKGEPIRFNLYAYTDYGAWLVHGMPGVEYRPTPTATMAQGVSTVGAPGDLQIAGVAPDEGTPFPLLARVGSSPGSITYTLAVYASNPYPQPLATTISQTLPAGVQVLNAHGGVVDGDQIVWHAIIQPREQAVLRYDFAYAGYGVTATLPAVNMGFYDAASSTTVMLTGQPSSFHTKTPLWAQATADLRVAPATQQTVSVAVSNLDTAAGHQGSLILRVTDVTGTEVLMSTTTPVSLVAGSSQNYDLIYTAPDEGLYVLEVALHYGDETTSVICDLLKVRENRVYLPVVLRN